MRVLVATSPGHGHMFATVPLAWAFRAAGHEVLFATSGRLPGDMAAIIGAGVTVAEIATPEQMADIRAGLRARTLAEAEKQGLTAAEMSIRNVDESRRARHVLDGNGWAFAVRIFGPMSAGTLDGLVDVATRWKPDLVVYESTQGGGPLVAALLDVPVVEHPIGFARGPQLDDALASFLAEGYARYGVKRPRRTAALDVSPPSMAIGPEYGWTMRYVPFNGGGLVGEWLSRPHGRPRIAVTLGTVLPDIDDGGFAAVAAAASELDADFVVTTSQARLSAVGSRPDNVQTCGYVPLAALLGSCDAIIHHGGSSTTMTALDAGLPQLVMPHLADQFINADAVSRRGCGLVAENTAAVSAGMRSLIEDKALAIAAHEVRAEMADLPAPTRMADRLTRWAMTDKDQGAQNG